MSLERYLVDVGADMMSRSSGPHFTFVNPNFHNNVELIVEQALRLVKLFADNHGVVTDRLVISVCSASHHRCPGAMTRLADSGHSERHGCREAPQERAWCQH
ncbi:hypothetical protein DAEQUDRAFT_609345 [Daedalea quercina L-15889]|uniref:Uncharacterized protein n=1 Tax=Daedalea quercina L-15889 TaxID=1314783 RepID=A0A165LIM6_9APHY|nr:hypothetical protein DAEQUDRAFT_609345 [Daedalea quercina L-15889]